jgi:uncharacterized protein (TIGR00251 family)
MTLRVTPGARSSRVAIETAADGTALVRVWVTAPAEGGKANAAMVALLAKTFGLPGSALVIERGAASRDKRLRIATG